MRNILKNAGAIAMVSAAALAVTACGKSETSNVSENVSMTDMNAEGSMNDMAATDMNGMGASNDMMASNTMSNDMGATDNGMMGGNTTSNMQ